MSSRATKILLLAQCKQQDDNLGGLPVRVCDPSKASEKHNGVDYSSECAMPGSLQNIFHNESPLQAIENNSNSEVDFDSNNSVVDKKYVSSSSDSESSGNYSNDAEYRE